MQWKKANAEALQKSLRNSPPYLKSCQKINPCLRIEKCGGTSENGCIPRIHLCIQTSTHEIFNGIFFSNYFALFQ